MEGVILEAHRARASAAAGLVAGALFAVVETIAAGVAGNPGMPWKMFASILLGRAAMEGGLTALELVLGAAIHFALSAVFGLVFAIGSNLFLKGRVATLSGTILASTAYGVGLYLVNFHVIGRAAYPWFLSANQPAQLLMHALAFGLPLGLLYRVSHEVRRRRVGAT